MSDCELWTASMQHFLPRLKGCFKKTGLDFLIFDLDTVSLKKIRKLVTGNPEKIFYGVAKCCQKRKQCKSFLDGVFNKAISTVTMLKIIEAKYCTTEKYTLNDIRLLQALRRGDCDRIIAQTYGLSISTVKYYLRCLYSKIGVSNRTQAAMVAAKIDV